MRLLVVHGHRTREESLRRVRAAEKVSADFVLFSGRGEAEFMRAAWQGPDMRYGLEARSKCTMSNVGRCLSPAKQADTVVVVTSWWHAPRAWLLWRRAGIRVEIRPSRGSIRHAPHEVIAFIRAYRSP